MGALGSSCGAFPNHGSVSFVLVDSYPSIRNSLHINRWRVKNVGISPRESNFQNLRGHLNMRSWLGAKWINAYTGIHTLAHKSCRQQATDDSEIDVVLLSNGPGEVATWVKPVLDSLRRQSAGTSPSTRISVILTPCPHASGRELELVKSYNEVDRCQGPKSFWNLLLFGFTEYGWTWRKRGVCVFLGGDQLYTLILSRRLGYKSIVYSEDSVRWPGIVDMYMLRSAQMLGGVPIWAQSKCKVVGDLFSDSIFGMEPQSVESSNSEEAGSTDNSVPIVGFLPGSKTAKLALGVPYFLAVANHLHRLLVGRVRFLLPLAPTATLSMLAKHADPSSNPNISKFHWASAKLAMNVQRNSYVDHYNKRLSDGVHSQRKSVGRLVTDEGVHIEILQQFPAYDSFRLCNLCVTTIGTNTAELGYLGIPMLVVLPTHALEVFRGGTGGALGVLANMPGGLGKLLAKRINAALLKSAGYVAWPNRWVNEEIVPELVGRIEPVEIASIAAHYLVTEKKLDTMKGQLLKIHLRLNETSNLVDCRDRAADAIASEVFTVGFS